MVALSWGPALVARAPDVEGLLERIFAGTGLLQGGASDYITALAVACAFPLMRFIMDRKVYGVSEGMIECVWAGQDREFWGVCLPACGNAVRSPSGQAAAPWRRAASAGATTAHAGPVYTAQPAHMMHQVFPPLLLLLCAAAGAPCAGHPPGRPQED